MRIGSALLLAGALALVGCSKVKEGIRAYYRGDYAKAERLLSKTAREAATADPRVSIHVDANTSVEQALPYATREAYEAWEAYVGSLIGQDRYEEGCRAAASALRPITVVRNGVPLSRKYDPRMGEYWSAEVMTLRAWWINVPCE